MTEEPSDVFFLLDKKSFTQNTAEVSYPPPHSPPGSFVWGKYNTHLAII